jgi:hypothetical protein
MHVICCPDTGTPTPQQELHCYTPKGHLSAREGTLYISLLTHIRAVRCACSTMCHSMLIRIPGSLLRVLLRVKHIVHLHTCPRTGRLLRVQAHLVLSLIHRPLVARAVAR